MRIRYEEPVDKTNMSLLATIAVIIFGGIIAVNFSSISDSAAETTITNLVNPLDPEDWNKNAAKYFTERII